MKIRIQSYNKYMEKAKTIEEWTEYFEEYSMELLGYPSNKKNK